MFDETLMVIASLSAYTVTCIYWITSEHIDLCWCISFWLAYIMCRYSQTFFTHYLTPSHYLDHQQYVQWYSADFSLLVLGTEQTYGECLWFKPFSPTLFLIVAKTSLPMRWVPYWSNPPFLIFDIRALRHSVLNARLPECQKFKNQCGALSSMALNTLKCNHLTPLGFKWLTSNVTLQTCRVCQHCMSVSLNSVLYVVFSKRVNHGKMCSTWLRLCIRLVLLHTVSSRLAPFSRGHSSRQHCVQVTAM